VTNAETPVFEKAIDVFARSQAGTTEAYRRFKELGFPKKNAEEWRDFDLDRILRSPFEIDSCGALSASGEKEIDAYLCGQSGQNRIVLVNGLWQRARSILSDFEAKTLSSKNTVDPRLADEKNPFSLVNAFSAKDGVWLKPKTTCSAERPLYVYSITSTHSPGSRAAAFSPRIEVHLPEGSRSTIVFVETVLGQGSDLTNTVFAAHLEKGSNLIFAHEIHSGTGPRLTQLRFRLSETSRLDSFLFQASPSFSRTEASTDFEGPHASAFFNGVGLLEKGSETVQRWTMNHFNSNGQSNQYYKTVLGGDAKAAFGTLVNVNSNGVKTDSKQLNKNLILSDLARVISRPQLEISIDEVSCFHGSATGQPSDEEIFYLRSRGFSERAARSLLIEGFIQEVFERMPVSVSEIRLRWASQARSTLERLLDSAQRSAA